MSLLSECSHGISEHLEASGLARAGESNKHDSKSDNERLMKLDDLLLEDLVVSLQPGFSDRLLELLKELGVVRLLDVDVREEVLNDGSEQRHIVFQELGDVGFLHRTD